MTQRSVVHSSFTLERTYPHPPHRVFAAWSDPVVKGRWLAGEDADHELDFRVGGTETARGENPQGEPLTFEARYQDIVQDERLVYTGVLRVAETSVTVSVTTVEFRPADGGTHLTLTEQGIFLDGQEQPEWRKAGTESQLTALGGELANTD